ncbi:unnamed protein product, partial [Symbiodinium necroappetens]
MSPLTIAILQGTDIDLAPSQTHSGTSSKAHVPIVVRELCSQWEQTVLLFEELSDQSLEVDVLTYTTILSACTQCTQWQKGVALAEEAVSLCLADEKLYNAAISACGEGNHWRRGLAFFEELLSSGLPVDIASCNAMIGACDRAGSWNFALAMLESASNIALRPTILTYAAAFRALANDSSRSSTSTGNVLAKGANKNDLLCDLLGNCQSDSMEGTGFKPVVSQGVARDGAVDLESLSTADQQKSVKMRTFASSFNYGVGVTSTLIEHKGSQLKITMKTPKGTSTSTIHINGTEQGSVDPMEDRPLRVRPQWEGKVLVVSSRRADSAKSLPTNRRFLQGVQMIVESTTQSGLVTRRIF